jgi:regulator of RNase E activity RraA
MNMTHQDAVTSPGSEPNGTPTPPWVLPVAGPPIPPLDKDLIDGFQTVSSATASAKLHQMGITKNYIQGPRTNKPRSHAVGRAVTLQLMPMREDIYYDSGDIQENVEKATALWAVFDHIVAGDFLVVQAWGSLKSGVAGEMLMRHLANRGGIGLVADGGHRDSAQVAKLEVPIWSLGSTPHYASQGELMPWGVHVPVAVGGVLVLPGDLIVADDDGAVVVPIRKARAVLESSTKHEEWEVFSRMKLDQGGDLRRYYPLDEVGRAEYSEWVRSGHPEAETKP